MPCLTAAVSKKVRTSSLHVYEVHYMCAVPGHERTGVDPKETENTGADKHRVWLVPKRLEIHQSVARRRRWQSPL